MLGLLEGKALGTCAGQTISAADIDAFIIVTKTYLMEAFEAQQSGCGNDH
jgi:hypothetical protein